MKNVEAYLLFMLAVTALGLLIICVGTLSIVLCQGASWILLRLHLGAFGHRGSTPD